MDIIGLSISRCIRDIVEHKIPLHWISKIIGGTSCTNTEEIWQFYADSHWHHSPLQTRRVFSQLRDEGKLDQPRLRNELPPDTTRGIWMVATIQMPTEELLQLIKVAEAFSKTPAEDRSTFIQNLSDAELGKTLLQIPTPLLRVLFPEIPEQSSIDWSTLSSFPIRNRLVEFFDQPPNPSLAPLRSHLLIGLAPFIKLRIMRLKASNFFEVPKNINLSRFS